MTVILVNAEAGRIPLPAGVVHCSVSSPPYYSLRAYKGDQARDWPEVFYHPQPGAHMEYIPPMTCALGHESTPEAFIAHLVACYREVKRVLRDDGVAWVVIGDSSASKPQQDNHADPKAQRRTPDGRCRTTSLGAGNRMLIPHRLALALQADGWVVRNDCVFAKKSPMPESMAGIRWERCRVKIKAQVKGDSSKYGILGHRDVPNFRPGYSELNQAQYTDCPGCPRCNPHDGYVLRRGSWRHTRAHETVLHLSKGMNYWSDGEAVREGLAQSSINRINQPTFAQQTGGDKDYRSGVNTNRSMRQTLENFAENPSGRNPRSVLTPAGEGGYSGAHYATYPKSLIRPLIKSSCPTRCCPECGAGWAAVMERGDSKSHPSQPQDHLPETGRRINGNRGNRLGDVGQYVAESNILGYRPTCDCTRKLAEQYTSDGPQTGAEWVRRLAEAAEQLAPVPGIILDPFVGSGTTLIVARELGLDCIGLDLSYDYLHDQARERLGLVALHEWEHGRNGQGEPLEELPLFAEVIP